MSKAIHILLGVAVLLALPLIYLVLLRPGQPMFPPSQWLVFAGAALALLLAAFLPGVVRRVRGMPPQAVSPSDLRFGLAVAAVLCPLAFLAVWVMGPFGAFIIVLAPVALIIRSRRSGELDQK